MKYYEFQIIKTERTKKNCPKWNWNNCKTRKQHFKKNLSLQYDIQEQKCSKIEMNWNIETKWHILVSIVCFLNAFYIYHLSCKDIDTLVKCAQRACDLRVTYTKPNLNKIKNKITKVIMFSIHGSRFNQSINIYFFHQYLRF